ncbi:hypothetical protein Tco_0846720 [Tanacetum coccineum]
MGNSKKRVTNGKDGVLQGSSWFQPQQEEQFADEKERKARTLLLMAVPKDHLRRFHGMDDAKEIWAAIKTRFGGNTNSKKMQKAVLKQQFEPKPLQAKQSQAKAQGKVIVRHTSFSKAKTKCYSDLDQIVTMGDWSDGYKLADCYDCLQIKKFYKKTGRRPRCGLKNACGHFDKRKVECFKIATIWAFCLGVQVLKVQREGSRQELAGRGQDFKLVRTEKGSCDSYNALQAKYDELQSEFGTQEAALVAHKLALKKYRRIGMKAVKDKDVLQNIVDSWFASSKNLWKLVDCGMSSTVKNRLSEYWHKIQYAEV